jgi:hypothetical protein
MAWCPQEWVHYKKIKLKYVTHLKHLMKDEKKSMQCNISADDYPPEEQICIFKKYM